MDVLGQHPKSARGEYFRNDGWWWLPLWKYCVEAGADIIFNEDALEGRHLSGWGLDAEGATRLGQRLQEKLQVGHTEQYAKEREQYLKRLPDEVCWSCGGTGWRAEPSKTGSWTRRCDDCGGMGHRRPLATRYYFEEDNVWEFAKFLTDSGGFEID